MLLAGRFSLTEISTLSPFQMRVYEYTIKHTNKLKTRSSGVACPDLK